MIKYSKKTGYGRKKIGVHASYLNLNSVVFFSAASLPFTSYKSEFLEAHIISSFYSNN